MTNEHDPLCPHREFMPGNGVWIEGFSDPPNPVQSYEPCQCDLIVQVRADERDSVVAIISARWKDLTSCRKLDDCLVEAKGIQLVLDDLLESWGQVTNHA